MTVRRPARRHSPLPLHELSPHDVFALGGLDGGDRDPAYPPALVVDAEQPAELLIGRARLKQHLDRQPHRTVKAYRVTPADHDARAAIAALDGWTTLAQLAAGLSALHDSGMPLSQAREVVRKAGHISDIGRTISIFRESPALFGIADKSRGRLRLGHLLKLHRAPPAAREHLAREVIAKRMSVAKLMEVMASDGANADADITSLSLQLGEALGTEVVVAGSASSGTVRIAWLTAESLQGICARLAGSRIASPTGPSLDRPVGFRRWVDIQYASAHEFDLLFGPLLRPDAGFGPG